MAKRQPKLAKNIVHLVPSTNIQQDRQRRVLDAISLKRRRPEISMSEAARKMGTTLRTVRKYGGSALQIRSGRIDTRPIDRIARDLEVLTDQGAVSIRVTNSRDASRIARHSNAIRKYVIYQDDSGLASFHGKTFKAGGSTYSFLTDKVMIDRLKRAGALTFQDIYSSVGGS